MTEKEKMQKGVIYNPNYDEELQKERLYAKDLCFAYNQLKPSEVEKRKEILQKLLGKTGENFWIEPSFFCDYGYQIEVGEDFYMNHNCVILDAAKVHFGAHVFIAPNCAFYTAEHPLNKEERNQGLEYARPIFVGNDVWIGGNVVVLPGVTIGDNCVIGAGSVVTKDIPANSIAYGNPCRVVRKIEEKG